MEYEYHPKDEHVCSAYDLTNKWYTKQRLIKHFKTNRQLQLDLTPYFETSGIITIWFNKRPARKYKTKLGKLFYT